MANEERIVMDPLGNAVYMPYGICPTGEDIENDPDIYDEAVRVIQQPALIIRPANEKGDLYYFRSIGWHNTLLITAHYNQRWEAVNCLRNPSTEELSRLIKNGHLLT